MSLFQYGEFISHSGLKLPYKIDCDALTDSDWDALAQIARDKVGASFSDVYGVPTGGLKLAAALKKYCTPSPHRVLVVDDVLTTGKSMEYAKLEFADIQAGMGNVIGFVVVARTKDVPAWITPLLWSD